jgi:hypothetical protein
MLKMHSTHNARATGNSCAVANRATLGSRIFSIVHLAIVLHRGGRV